LIWIINSASIEFNILILILQIFISSSVIPMLVSCKNKPKILSVKLKMINRIKYWFRIPTIYYAKLLWCNVLKNISIVVTEIRNNINNHSFISIWMIWINLMYWAFCYLSFVHSQSNESGEIEVIKQFKTHLINGRRRKRTLVKV